MKKQQPQSQGERSRYELQGELAQVMDRVGPDRYAHASAREWAQVVNRKDRRFRYANS